MNLHDPSPSTQPHPRPTPATPANSPWWQPPPRAPKTELSKLESKILERLDKRLNNIIRCMDQSTARVRQEDDDDDDNDDNNNDETTKTTATMADAVGGMATAG